MIILKIILSIVGLAFLLFGFFIFFRKRYNLINGFADDYKAGRKSENYARRIGLIEFIIGIIMLLAAVILIIFIK